MIVEEYLFALLFSFILSIPLFLPYYLIVVVIPESINQSRRINNEI